MEPQIGHKSCKLVWDSSVGLVNRRAPKKSVALSKKTVSFGNVAKKPRKSLVAARISFFEDHNVENFIVEDNKTENGVVEHCKVENHLVEDLKTKNSVVENSKIENCKVRYNSNQLL